MILWTYSCFIPYLKDFVLVFKIIFKTSPYSSIGRAFKHIKIFSNHIFENSYLQRAIGWATMPCMRKIENLFKHVHEREVAMRYT